MGMAIRVNGEGLADFPRGNTENTIMKNLLATAAVVALFAAAPAFAADNNAAPAAPDQSKTDLMKKPAPAADQGAAATDQNTDQNKAATAPAPTDQNKAAAAPAPTDQNKTATAAGGPPKFITQQTDQEKLASKMMGKSIYNAANESVGKVSDLVMSENGQIDAVVIGVGGFLGIGEKSVAVPFSAITVANDKDGNPKFTAQMSKDDLNKAPDFLTLADLKAKAEANAPAPAAPGSPAPAQ
jgi:sporulation protein YlmC with PRC-barrel domain